MVLLVRKSYGKSAAERTSRRQRTEDPAIGIDRNGDAAVRCAHDPAAIFDGADTCHAEMLLGGRGVPKPAVVRNIHEELCAVGGEAPNLTGINRFVADEHAEGIAVWELADGIFGAFAKATDFTGYVAHHAMNQRKRFVLAERNEMDFVVGKVSMPLRVEHQRAIVGRHNR